jgi:predicted RNase H-like nuclease (RuvC/YqgF family)
MSLKVILRGLAILLAACSLYSVRVFAQDDSTSVAEAARQARQQKQDAAKPAHVIDNDAIPPSPAASNASGSANAPAAANASQAADAKPEGSADEDKNKEEMEALKKQIADKKEQVDFQKREIALAQDTYYSNPDRSRDNSGKEKIDAMQADLAQAQSELNELEAKLAAAGPAPAEKSSEPAKP